MRKVPEGESRNRAIKPSKRAYVFSIFLCCFCGVFHSRMAGGLWSEKRQSERQLFFSTSAKTSRPALSLDGPRPGGL